MQTQVMHSRSDSDAREQLKMLINTVGIGFHPDTPISEYTDLNGEQAFTGKAALAMQYLLHELFDHFGMEIYAVGLELHAELFPEDYELLFGEDGGC